jgi:hypothetical protein
MRPRQRCQWPGAPEARIAVERLRPRDLGAPAREQVGAQRPLALRHRPDGDDRLDEIAPGVVPGLRAVGRVRVRGLHRREIARLHRLELARSRARRQRRREGEQEQESSHAHVVPRT